ncbi:MAG TPA: 2OG-Fe(II) oxygenase family protein [Caulobacteraceae bacterium]
MALSIDPALRPERLAAAFARHGRMHVPGFLPPPEALRVGEALAREARWRRAVNQGEKTWDLPLDQLAALSPEDQAKLDAAAHTGAAQGFQFLFDTYRLSDEVDAGRGARDALEEAYRFLNGEVFLSFVRALTGDTRPAFCDAQATRYLPGHFLTAHDDDVQGKGRLYAYVLNFTPEWMPDWGGLLLFLDQDGHVAEGYTPSFNALNIFRVPQRHTVSIVAPFARRPRLSITGWVRA